MDVKNRMNVTTTKETRHSIEIIIRGIKMPHSWKMFDIAEKITNQLIEAGIITAKDELRVRGIIQITLEDIPTLTELLSKIEWRNILMNAIKSRQTSWGQSPVREWRNAGDTIYCALINELRRMGYVY